MVQLAQLGGAVLPAGVVVVPPVVRIRRLRISDRMLLELLDKGAWGKATFQRQSSSFHVSCLSLLRW